MRERQRLEGAIASVERLEREVSRTERGLIAMGEAEGDAQVVEDAEAALKVLRVEAERRQVETMLSGRGRRQ